MCCCTLLATIFCQDYLQLSCEILNIRFNTNFIILNWVLSPLLWCPIVLPLVFDLRTAGFHSEGYVDDISVMVCGKFEGVVELVRVHKKFHFLADRLAEDTESRMYLGADHPHEPKSSDILVFVIKTEFARASLVCSI